MVSELARVRKPATVMFEMELKLAGRQKDMGDGPSLWGMSVKAVPLKLVKQLTPSLGLLLQPLQNQKWVEMLVKHLQF